MGGHEKLSDDSLLGERERWVGDGLLAVPYKLPPSLPLLGCFTGAD